MRFILLIPLFFILAACDKTAEISKTENVFTVEHAFTDKLVEGGSISDGLDIIKIDYQDHGDFERFILSVALWEGAGELAKIDAATTGHFELIPISKNEKQLYLEGYRTLSAVLPASKKTTLKRLRGEEYEDDSTVALSFSSINNSNCHRVFSEPQLSKIFIDIKPC